MTATESIGLSAVTTGDTVAVFLTRPGISRVALLLRLHIHGFIEIAEDDRQQLLQVERTGRWQPNVSREVHFTATRLYDTRLVEGILAGYIEGMPTRVSSWAASPDLAQPSRATTASTRAKTTRKTRKAPQPNGTASGAKRQENTVTDSQEEMVSLQTLEAALAFGFSHSKLGELLSVRSSAIADWLMEREQGAQVARSYTPDNGKKLTALYNITTLLVEERGLTTREAVLWWSKPHFMFSKERPGDLFKLGRIQQVRKAAEKAGPAQTTTWPTTGV